MGDIITLRKNAHDEAQELLPWFVNGSLAPDEAKRVEAHRAPPAPNASRTSARSGSSLRPSPSFRSTVTARGSECAGC
jgi:hypothetical protein